VRGHEERCDEIVRQERADRRRRRLRCGRGLRHRSLCAGAGQQTPKGWSYTIDKDGRRVPKGNRVTNPDGSWREELKQGNCVTIKERSAAGEYKETRQCNPGSPN
jgi:hypothetical protein